MLVNINYGKVPKEFAHYFSKLSKEDAMINYEDANEAVKEIIDKLTSKYEHDIREFPIAWVEYAFNCARINYSRVKLEKDIKDYCDTDSIKEVRK